MSNKQLLQQALDALKSASPLGGTSSSDDVADAAHKKHCDALKALRTAIAQDDSEPVAYSSGNTLHWHKGKGLTDAQLYAAPQVANDYVPLSDEQIDDITKKTWPCVSDVVMPAYLAAYRGYARAVRGEK